MIEHASERGARRDHDPRGDRADCAPRLQRVRRRLRGDVGQPRRQAQNAADAGALAGAISLMPRRRLDANAKVRPRLRRKQFHHGARPTCRAAPNIAVLVRDRRRTRSAVCGLQPGCVRVDVFRNEPDRERARPAGNPHADVLRQDCRHHRSRGCAPRRRRETARGTRSGACCRLPSSTGGRTTTTTTPDDLFCRTTA